MRIRVFFIISVLVVLLSSCSTQKKVTKQIDYTSTELTLPQRYKYLVDGYAEWKNLYIPVKLKLNSPQKMSVSARVTMQRDESILFSLRVLGMEVGNVFITTDSIFAVDKIHNYFLAESLKSVFKNYDLTIADIQNILLGQAFMEGHGSLDKGMRKKVVLDENVEQWTITPKKQPENINYFFTLTKTDNQLSKLSVKHINYPQVECSYSGMVESVAGFVARNTTIDGMLGKTHLNAVIEWNQKSADWNYTKERTWSAPKNYTRISAEQLIKAFTSQN